VATSLTVRGGDQAPYITDNGNLILDLTLAEGIGNAPALAAKLKAMIGLVQPDCSSA
jgi:ribose 5-phosphate isomerase